MDDEDKYTYKVKCSFEFEINAKGQDNADEIAWDEAVDTFEDLLGCGKVNLTLTRK